MCVMNYISNANGNEYGVQHIDSIERNWLYFVITQKMSSLPVFCLCSVSSCARTVHRPLEINLISRVFPN